MIARNKESYEYFKKSFQKRKIKKTYRAIVYGNVESNTGEINSQIGRSKRDFRLRATEGSAIGNLRDAFTCYKVLNRAGEYSHLEVYPETGRTHQIRVHLKSISHPIVCDSLYAKNRFCPESLGRLALHAFEISFTLPDDIRATFRADEPEEFGNFLAETPES